MSAIHRALIDFVFLFSVHMAPTVLTGFSLTTWKYSNLFKF